jgi:ribonucleoside-triphosphate reductase (formate)
MSKKKKTNQSTRTRCEMYSRVVGYLRPINQWNDGKRQEYKDRKVFKVDEIENPGEE